MRIASSTLALLLLSACSRAGVAPDPCWAQDCSGHGRCGVTLAGEALCACEPGYRNRDPLVCARDPSYGVVPEVDAAALLDAGAVERAGSDGAGRDLEDAAGEDAAGEDAGDAGGLVWVQIPAGAFEMGCAPGDPDCSSSEEPRHTVAVAAFEMLRTELTQAQYLAAMGVNPSYFSASGGGVDCGLDCPVEQLDWYHAEAVCAAIGGRLPSAAEWEYAARAGTATRFFCGDDPTCLDDVAWTSRNADTGDGFMPHPVATKGANAFGLHDVHGNVFEYVAECQHATYDGAPSTGEVWAGGDCQRREMRSGSFMPSVFTHRLSIRIWTPPDDAYRFKGVRCAR